MTKIIESKCFDGTFEEYIKAHLEELDPEDRLKGLDPEEVLSKYDPKDRLKGLSLREIEDYLEKLKKRRRH